MRFDVDRNGSYLMRFPHPRNVSSIEVLAQTFCTHEAARPADQRTPYHVRINTLLQQSTTFSEQKTTGKALAVTSSEEAKRLNARAKALVRQIQNVLGGLYAATPEQATEWGFEVRQSGSRAGTILLPQTRDEILWTLKKYIDTEQGRLPAEQIPVPHLTEVVQVYEGLRDSLETRHTGTTTRKTGVAGTYEIAEALMDFLQAAVMHLVMNDFDRKVTPELGLWGFHVIARPAKSNGNGDTPALDGGPTPGAPAA